MNNLGDYFGELVHREGKPNANLAARWRGREIRSIARCISGAFERCRFGHHPLLVTPRITGPAMGNRLASFFANELGERLRNYRIETCSGQGYPDRRLVKVANQRSYALELKATRSFEPKSNHRVILTCSSRKLRRHFVPPINHLLVTVFYSKHRNRVWIENFRLDFLEPWSRVRVRLEASVSQHLLAEGKHSSFWHFPGLDCVLPA